jgi:hypothetical protein
MYYTSPEGVLIAKEAAEKWGVSLAVAERRLRQARRSRIWPTAERTNGGPGRP